MDNEDVLYPNDEAKTRPHWISIFSYAEREYNGSQSFCERDMRKMYIYDTSLNSWTYKNCVQIDFFQVELEMP